MGHLLAHARAVADKALMIARRMERERPDLVFLEQAALLHDVGILFTHAPALGCAGRHPYIRHGILGRKLLEAEGLPRHALVCERHVGVGLTESDIERQGLPLPGREMVPVSIEEEIVCYADKFFSKDGDPRREKPLDEVRELIRGYGEDKLAVFEGWRERFEGD
jgi:uncharacterized protein